MSVYKRGNVWWFKFVWRGERIQETTKQSNKRIAEQIEAARRTALAKGEVGLRDRPVIPTVQEFAAREFLPFCEARFADKPRTLAYYRDGLKHLEHFPAIANSALDSVTADS